MWTEAESVAGQTIKRQLNLRDDDRATAYSVVLQFDGKDVWEDPPQSPSEVSTWGYFFTSRPGNIK